MAEKAAEDGLDLAECHAYSDSINDLPSSNRWDTRTQSIRKGSSFG